LPFALRRLRRRCSTIYLRWRTQYPASWHHRHTGTGAHAWVSGALIGIGLEEYLPQFEKGRHSTVKSIAELSDDERRALSGDISKKQRETFLEWATGLSLLVPALSDALVELGLEDHLSDFEKASHSTIDSVVQLSDTERRTLPKDIC
jgi:hypothetical protein